MNDHLVRIPNNLKEYENWIDRNRGNSNLESPPTYTEEELQWLSKKPEREKKWLIERAGIYLPPFVLQGCGDI